MSNVRNRKVFNVYEGLSPDDVVMAVQLSEENFETIAKITGGKIDLGEPCLLVIGPDLSEDKTIAEVGDYIISDMAGGHRAFDKEIFEDVYSLSFSEDWSR